MSGLLQLNSRHDDSHRVIRKEDIERGGHNNGNSTDRLLRELIPVAQVHTCMLQLYDEFFNRATGTKHTQAGFRLPLKKHNRTPSPPQPYCTSTTVGLDQQSHRETHEQTAITAQISGRTSTEALSAARQNTHSRPRRRTTADGPVCWLSNIRQGDTSTNSSNGTNDDYHP